MTEFLTTEDLLVLIADLGVGPVRDHGLLDSAAHRPTTVVFGQDAYPSIDEKAAALLESIVRNHALVDGNKRLGWLAVVVFLGLNGISLDAPDDPAYDLVIAVTIGASTVPETAARLRSWRAP
ncbi:type II toxin-antitoxin system death-on-curing family toxin [Nakamurella leprariae]|uniref:Type II toxin-antitoxin system death-on-curing family toxin n=1 Tax=Nakamurella leprariae TaxID=2803911 RepID=A0A938YIN1_9ACTN|nr:type II toxin-antitoxin system death-on-curing family toxin [Nakamurella leprariae]MBM9469012.1 type II toxin-antitoxin system death-on-curing family toxin [Nakamurella leprariae]